MESHQKQVRFTGLLIMLLALTLAVAGVYAFRSLAIIPGILGLAFFLAYRPVFGTWPPFHKHSLMIVLGILALGGLSSLWSYDPSVSLERTGKMALAMIPALFLVSVAAALPPAAVQRFLWMIPASIAVLLGFLLVDLASDFSLWRAIKSIPAEQRIRTSDLNRPVVMVALFLFPAAFYVWRVVRAPSKRGALIVFFTGLLLTVFALSDSEASVFAFGAGLLALFLFPYRLRVAWYGAAVLFALCVFSAPWAVQWAFENHAETVHESAFLGQGGGHGAHRLEIYNFVGKRILKSPFYGYGIEGFRSKTFETDGIYYERGRSESVIHHPHNFALQAWIEFGLIGAVLAVAFACYLLRRIYALGHGLHQRFMMASFVAFFAIAAVTFNVWHGWWIGVCFILLVYLVLLDRVLAADRPESDQNKAGIKPE